MPTVSADRVVFMQSRELSWLKFNERVLHEANRIDTPLLERLKFISIFTSNLDEFFMIRVGALTDSMLLDKKYRDKTAHLLSQNNVNVVTLPKTIDNDVYWIDLLL